MMAGLEEVNDLCEVTMAPRGVSGLGPGEAPLLNVLAAGVLVPLLLLPGGAETTRETDGSAEEGGSEKNIVNHIANCPRLFWFLE